MTKSTIRKCVLNVIAAPNPTQYIKFDKYSVEDQTSRLVRNTDFADFFNYFASGSML